MVANGSLFILPGYHPSTASLGCNYSDGYLRSRWGRVGFHQALEDALEAGAVEKSTCRTVRRLAPVTGALSEARRRDVSSMEVANFMAGAL